MARNLGDWDNVSVNFATDTMTFGLADKAVLVLSSSLTASVSFLSASNRLYAPGGFADSFTYFKTQLTPSEACPMTASTINSGSGGFYKVYTKVPMVRGGSVLGLALYSETSTVTVGAVSASVTIDGANISSNATGTFLITTADNVAVAYVPYLYNFSASQVIGVSITASANYSSGSNANGWAATVLVEI